MQKETNGTGSALYVGCVDTRSGALNVRAEPGGGVIGSVARAETVRVIADEGEWLGIEYGDGVGYVEKRFIRFAQAAGETGRLVMRDAEGNVFLPKGECTLRIAEGPID